MDKHTFDSYYFLFPTKNNSIREYCSNSDSAEVIIESSVSENVSTNDLNDVILKMSGGKTIYGNKRNMIKDKYSNESSVCGRDTWVTNKIMDTLGSDDHMIIKVTGSKNDLNEFLEEVDFYYDDSEEGEEYAYGDYYEDYYICRLIGKEIERITRGLCKASDKPSRRT